jgi:hypothetical protein
MRFVGRSKLLGDLDGWYREVARGGAGRMLVMRGRRQVGKSRLITEFLTRSAAPHIFFTALKNGSPAAQLEAFRRDVFDAARPVPEAESLFASAPATWADAVGRLRLAAQSGPLAVVLDEFPWAVESDPTLEAVLQAAWDRHLQHLPALVVLVGSDVAIMERLTAHDRPLYGRGREVEVRAFNPAECAAAVGHLSPTAAFDAYLVTGGYPKLVADLGRVGSVRGFVEAGTADENTDLVVVAQRSLAAEFPPEAQARRVLSAIGAHPVGHATFTTVVGRLPEEGKAAETALTRALRLLVDVKGLVAIDTPAGAPSGTRLRRYRITDPYLRFWFRFLEPNVANIARGRPDLAVAGFSAGWQSWRGAAIEPVVRDAVARLAPELEALEGITDVTGWWNRDGSTEVDLVATHRTEVRAIGSVKWRERRAFDHGELTELAEARSVVPHAGAARLVAVCPAGTRAGVKADVVLRAEDLLAGWTA